MAARNSPDTDPDAYVRENRETLIEIIKHGNDRFVRALSLAALMEYGDDVDKGELRDEIDRLDELGDRLDVPEE